MRDVDKVPGHGRLQSESEGHDWEGHSAAALWGRASDESPDDHGDRHHVVAGEVREVVVPEGKHPPTDHLQAINYLIREDIYFSWRSKHDGGKTVNSNFNVSVLLQIYTMTQAWS